MSNPSKATSKSALKDRTIVQDIASILIWVVLFVVAFYAIILIGLGNTAFIYKDV